MAEVKVYTCEGHLLCGVELDGVDCEEDNKDETKRCIKYPTAKDKNQPVQNLKQCQTRLKNETGWKQGEAKLQLHYTQKSAKT